MTLDKYKQKRDFKKTPEPKGRREKKAGALRFSFQRHEARRLHYDLRLEMEGVLKSWAIPKGPSQNPNDKRLAMMTEDHPLDYITFEGIIPKGNYGAGRVIVYDKGNYHHAGGKSEKDLLKDLEMGNLKIVFEGEKVKGTFALVKTHGEEENNQWLLIKKKDEYAVDEPFSSEDFVDDLYKDKKEPLVIKLNEFIRPMLAKKTNQAFDNPDWIYELKWDGYRAIASNLEKKVQLYSRNGLSFNAKFKPIADCFKYVHHDVILDGEIVVLDKDGKPQFQMLQNYESDPQGELRYYVFDILHLNGHDIMHLPLTERKSLIPEVIEDAPNFWYCDHVEGMGTAFFNRAAEAGMEGIIAKKADSIYSPGTRTDNWLKIKTLERQEAIICGFTKGKGSRKYFGSLILGIHDGEKLKYAGNCGGGFDDKLLKEVYEKIEPLIIEKSPFDEKINLKGNKPTWIKPELICEIVFAEWTKSGHMRQPIFKGLRNDKAISEVKKEEESANPPQNKTEAHPAGDQQLEIDGIPVHFSNLEKVYWPEEKIKKYDLIEYYLAISEYILPYLKDRPQNLHRHPNGIQKEGFFHKDTGEIMPYWVETVKVFSESNGKDINYMICQNTATLLYMANLGCIEINPWHSRKENLLMPDYTIIDLDPGEKRTFEDVIETAQAVKEVLDTAKIPGYCKTSGSRGLHIYIPLGAKYDYDQARDFTKLLCYMVNSMLPDLTSMERDPKKRKDKIYLDFLQNRRGQTLAAPYCIRPRPGATASAPLEWGEVKKGLNKMDFNIHTMYQRIQEKGDLFKGIMGKGIDMEKTLSKLG